MNIENSQPDAGFGVVDTEVIKTMSGLEFIRKIALGELPAATIARTLSIRLTEVEKGRVVFMGIPTQEMLNPIGSVHAGFAATIMDSALACCVHTHCAIGYACTTIEFKINFVRPILPDTGTVFCEGNAVHFGRTIATSEATLKDINGRLLAHGTETCAVYKLP